MSGYLKIDSFWSRKLTFYSKIGSMFPIESLDFNFAFWRENIPSSPFAFNCSCSGNKISFFKRDSKTLGCSADRPQIDEDWETRDVVSFSRLSWLFPILLTRVSLGKSEIEVIALSYPWSDIFPKLGTGVLSDSLSSFRLICAERLEALPRKLWVLIWFTREEVSLFLRWLLSIFVLGFGPKKPIWL